MLTPERVELGYKYLKSYAYFENINLFLKARVAEFESQAIRDNALFQQLSETIFSGETENNDALTELINSVDFKLIAKGFENNSSSTEPNYVTNFRSAESYKVSKVNYFFDGPAELWLIDILWTLYVGPLFDNALSKDCYGNRLKAKSLSLVEPSNSSDSKDVFVSYISQYNDWRNGAIETAKRVTTEGDNVAIVALDIKQYFYNIDLKFQKITAEIESLIDDKEALEFALFLTNLLEKIYKKYSKKIKPQLKYTHKGCENNVGLPIGLTSSTVLANWYLSGFDREVSDIVRPAYYGRYVDDILFGFKRPKLQQSKVVKSFIEDYLSSAISIEDKKFEVISEFGNLEIQQEKVQLHQYHSNHSTAGLDVIIEALQKQSSEYRLLPDGSSKVNLSNYANEFLYDGHESNLKNVLKASENEGGLSQFLSKQIALAQGSRQSHHRDLLIDITKLFKGQNILRFFRLWEKVYQFAIVLKEYDIAAKFYQNLQVEISLINSASIQYPRKRQAFVETLREHINLYNNISFSMVIAALDIRLPQQGFGGFQMMPGLGSNFIKPKESLDKIIDENRLKLPTQKIRSANLFKHYLSAWPLANYTDYEGDLTCQKAFLGERSIRLNQTKVNYTPRYIHFDEWQTFDLFRLLNENSNLPSWIKDSEANYFRETGNSISNFNVYEKSNQEDKITTHHIVVGQNSKRAELKLGLANFVVPDNDIASALRTDTPTNLSNERQCSLNSMLNSAVRDNVDVLVFPEVSVPVEWLPNMVHFARLNRIGLIFGLEHWVVGGNAHNLIVEVLPFQSNGKYNSCAILPRLKNHYAPAEQKLLHSLRLYQPQVQKPAYHRVSWNGTSLSTYNCFELSDISHRVLFKSQLDLLVACVWNRDTNYYQHILESTVRDLHCYTVQSNTSQYGGSCVLQPSRTENKTLLYVKGGENSSILSTKLNIKKLRQFHYQSSPTESDKGGFKPLPPGFDHNQLNNR